MSKVNNQPTQEQLQRWAELDNLEQYASFVSPILEEEQEHLVDRMMNGSGWNIRLQKLRDYKRKLIEEAAKIEKREKWVVEHIEKE
ncbi:MAG: hypothetical protein KME60_01235 [Cyanomargarita calcarea GSE-NOS-MK-12-04C]|jgi:DNA mismatch repair ATPase MutS|uniref:Uncharacterized protein n=1 Tax=Cyanomargarita calcarea GSE-NOS-MK-12-04C TaxID=2839659 RepID=A0A951QGV5_9CYAN|nr:hypothetical protein [Cyanomargarita calcarea GSE-NOS-MK-12-04C]